MRMLFIQTRRITRCAGVLLLAVGLVLPRFAAGADVSVPRANSSSAPGSSKMDHKPPQKNSTAQFGAHKSGESNKPDNGDNGSNSSEEKNNSGKNQSSAHTGQNGSFSYDQKLPFHVTFYHPGVYYDHAVKVHVIEDSDTQTLKFNNSDFTCPNEELKQKVPDNLGYAGLKLLHTLGDLTKIEAVASRVGASYFRGRGAHEHYGPSACGLAIDTGNTQKGEEVPDLTQFWLAEPGKQSKDVTLYALLNSPSITGGYKFVIAPDQATHTHIEETLFTRNSISKLGMAPLTSMFTWGENSLARLKDYRPEAHDSDGIVISSANGEWLWRPLANLQTLWMNDFEAKNVRGFGLMQRDRKFDDYKDLNQEYENRPNVWVTPDDHWGKGLFQLVEIPSYSEVNDNVSVYWVPAEPVQAGRRLHFSYGIEWSTDLTVPNSLGHTVAPRVGMAAVSPGIRRTVSAWRSISSAVSCPSSPMPVRCSRTSAPLAT